MEGPITYDLVSLLRDAYVEWDEERQIDWAVRYWQRARKAGLPVDADFSAFWRDFEWMGVQRQLKVLGIFARLYHRDGKAAYLDDMPRVLRYLRRACERYDALHPLRELLDEIHGGASMMRAASAERAMTAPRDDADIGAMILAAGRGERMRPLSDTTPKPLLEAGGKPLIVWQIEALARAGFRDIVVNAAHLQEQFVEALGDGAAFGVSPPLVVRGRAARSGGRHRHGAAAPAARAGVDRRRRRLYGVRLRVVPRAGPRRWRATHPTRAPISCWSRIRPTTRDGDFALVDGRVALDGAPRHTYASIGVYDTALFRELPRGAPLKLLPYLQRWIADGQVSGETFDGAWANVGSPEDLAQLDAALRSRWRRRRRTIAKLAPSDSRRHPPIETHDPSQ